jgi:DNA polymerase
MPRADAIRLDEVRAEAATCTRCELYRDATQTVFGEGPAAAWLMFVGEQPGDREDVAGKPFVGPAGHLLDRALDEVGIDRREVYLTNAVKHFRWERSGKRRLHKTPGTEHVRACRLWLDQELELVAPSVVVCLGSVAAKALLGSKFRVTRDRGRFLPWPGEAKMLATVHPSSVLRADDRDAAYAAFVGDLRPVVDVRPG